MNPFIRLNNKTVKELIINATELCYKHQSPIQDKDVEKMREILMENFLMQIPRNYNDNGMPPIPKPDFKYMFEKEHMCWDSESLGDKERHSEEDIARSWNK